MRALAVRVLVLLASAIATAAVLAGQQVVVVTRDGPRVCFAAIDSCATAS